MRQGHYFFIALLIFIAGCQLTLNVRSDSAFLDKETEQLAFRKAIPISAKIIIQDDMNGVTPHIYTSKVGTPFTISLPYSEMINKASHATVERWFQQDSGSKDVYIFAELVDLFYFNHTDVGSNRPVIALKLQVTVKQGNHVLHEGIYESGSIKGEKFGMTFFVGVGDKFEEFYSRAVYKAMLVALDKSMPDILAKLQQ